MKIIKQAVIALAASVAFTAPGFAAEDAHSHGHGAGDAKLELNHGKQWPTDEPLRKGMESIRGAVAKNVKAIHANKATPGEYEALAKTVSTEVAGIVQNCKLAPDADAQLHLVIGEMMAGAEAMEGKAKGETRRAGAERVAKALNAYGKHFNHPGWKAL